MRLAALLSENSRGILVACCWLAHRALCVRLLAWDSQDRDESQSYPMDTDGNRLLDSSKVATATADPRLRLEIWRETLPQMEAEDSPVKSWFGHKPACDDGVGVR